MDLEVSPALTIPATELGWRFSRSSGPGGQHVNTSDSRVQVSWNIADSAVLTDVQRTLLLTRLDGRLVAGVVTIAASEQRSQLRNREIALAKLDSGDRFYESKLATIRFYFARLYPETAMLIRQARSGAANLTALDADLF